MCVSLCAMDTRKYKKPIIVCDLQLLAPPQDPEESAEIPTLDALKLFASSPLLSMKLGLNSAKIKENGIRMAKEGESGAANVTYKVLSVYGNISEDKVKHLTQYAIKSTVQKTGLDLVKFLTKECQFSVIGISDQDRIHHEIFREKVKDAIDLGSELSGIVTLPYVVDEQQGKTCHPEHPQWELTNIKDKTKCYEAICKLADAIDEQAPIVIVQSNGLHASDGMQPATNKRFLPVTYRSMKELRAFLTQQGFLQNQK